MIIPSRGLIAEARFKPAPSEINTKVHLWSAFGNSETEVSAGWICRAAQSNGDWRPVTIDDIEKIYGENHKDGFRFNRLIEPCIEYGSQGRFMDGGGWIIRNGDSYYFTEEFIVRCYLSSTQRSNEIEPMFPETDREYF